MHSGEGPKFERASIQPPNRCDLGVRLYYGLSNYSSGMGCAAKNLLASFLILEL